jgi:hypothetical protein
MHRPGWRHWVPGTGGARPAAARPWVGPAGLPVHARPQASPADSPLTLPRWRVQSVLQGALQSTSKGIHAAGSKAVHAPGWAKVVHAESKVHVQGIGPRTMVRQGQKTVQQARVRAKVS